VFTGLEAILVTGIREGRLLQCPFPFHFQAFFDGGVRVIIPFSNSKIHRMKPNPVIIHFEMQYGFRNLFVFISGFSTG
jgi:hypothetical protein